MGAVISYQSSAISYQLSAISYQLSVISVWRLKTKTNTVLLLQIQPCFKTGQLSKDLNTII